MIILLLKATQPGLFDKLVQVRASVGVDGTVRSAHTAIRHVRPKAALKVDVASDLFERDVETLLPALPQSRQPVSESPSGAGVDGGGVASEPIPEAALDPEFEEIEDHQDLADAMASDPHSDQAKALISKIAARRAPPPPAAIDDLDPSSPNYRFRDTGYVAGSRKELATSQIRRISRLGEMVRTTDIDWDGLEENPREASELVVKETLFGVVGWEALRDAGMSPGAGFLTSRIYAAVGPKPAENTPAGRRDYALAINSLRDRLEVCVEPENVQAVLADMRGERDGEVLNEAEASLYAAASAVYRAEAAKVREIDAGNSALSDRASAIGGRLWPLERELEKRRRRAWKTDPEKEDLVAGMKAERDAILAEQVKFRVDKGMNAIAHQSNTATSRSLRLEYPYRQAADRAHQSMREIKYAARMRNAVENPLTRAWHSLGKAFNAVVDYRGPKGSDAFAKHVAAVKAGHVTDWEWALAKREVRGASQRSTTFQLEVADTIERTGGRSVDVHSTEALKSRFNLREVQSGNWVLDDPNSAKFHIEACGGAFADLADVLGLPDHEVSFRGRLAMAFGARGKGRAKAHYEPVERVINMTKMSGAGSLAHEWFHCIDNLVKEAISGIPSDVDDFGTENPAIIDHPVLHAAFAELSHAMVHGSKRASELLEYTEAEQRWAENNMAVSYGGGVRGQVKAAASAQDAVDAVERAYQAGSFGNRDKRRAKTTRDSWRKIALIHHAGNSARQIRFETGPGMSTFMFDALNLDGGQAGKYWSTPHEMAARAFSSYIEDELSGQGRANTYLVSHANNDIYRAMGEAHRPFPETEERARTNAAFRRLFEIIRADNILAKALQSAGACLVVDGAQSSVT